MARPRNFDQQLVLDKIMRLFWQNGYAGTSIDDIVKVTGLKKGSLYAGFGNKETLFRLSIENYLLQGAAALPRKQKAIETLCQFYSYIIAEACEGGSRRGCLIFNSCLEFSNRQSPLKNFVLSVGKQREAFFLRILQEAQTAKEIPARVDPLEAGSRAFATAFTIREISKFKPERIFLRSIANQYLESIGTKRRI